jgi:hypothetical protein
MLSWSVEFLEAYVTFGSTLTLDLPLVGVWANHSSETNHPVVVKVWSRVYLFLVI